jgi:hypothetical protein
LWTDFLLVRLGAAKRGGYDSDAENLSHWVMVLNMSFSPSVRLLGLLATGCIALTACSSSGFKPNPTDPTYAGIGGPGDPNQTRLGGSDSGVIFGTTKKRDSDQGGGGAGIGVNAYLWRGALDTLSFMPLASADPFGGVIITDWYSPPAATGERFKATAYILGRDLRSDALRVSIFRQVLQNGQWVDAPVSSVTTADIENKVLDRARKIREQQAKS